MAGELQIPGGTAETESLFTGLARSLRVDTSNWELRLHDGSTPGGFRFLALDALLEIFQVTNPELNGFRFSAAAKGFMTRIAPGQYVLRTLTVNAGQFDITDPQGLTGDPLIALKDTISTPHTWADTQTFESAVQAPAGVVGNVTGNTAGAHTGNVAGNVTGDTAGAHVGNVDVRSHNLLLDNGQINWSKLDPTSIPAGAAPIPSGGIMLWSGAATAIPVGWFLCDGANGTPNLVGMFIIGADATAPVVGATGGATNHNHVINISAAGAHAHTITIDNTTLTTAQIPAHHHGAGVCDTSALAFNHGTMAAVPTAQDIQTNSGSSGVVEALTTDTGGGTGHNHTATMDSGGSHTHTVSSNNHDNLPPYYALCYIMKA